ncbi:hypothetical protein B0J11DRAFT_505877 [Dendryphion nanum]|uniref:Uncharacterized protein n=1 Tax=Dendryphion nanum TaxID=256645 RepID=A0A9P9DXF4_9PLEO|nr:hypothetical protein B0J11DRAFT_505877 [Dendryphion nanum]
MSAALTDYSHNGRHFSTNSLSHPLIQAAREDPGRIDALLGPYLHKESLPEDLQVYLEDYISIPITPGLYGDSSPDRPCWYYANCLIVGMLLGRAFALLSKPTRPPQSLSSLSEFPFSRLPAELRLQIYEQYKEDLAHRKRYWDVMTRVFIRALWSGRDPEEGARYITGILMLTCGHALSENSWLLHSRGSKWLYWSNHLSDPDRTWGWNDLRSAVMSTVNLPRANTNIQVLRKRWERWTHIDPMERQTMGLTLWPEYVSRDTLAVLDLAREHLRADERDWTPPELVSKLLNGMFEDMDEAKKIWEATGFVPQVYEGLARLEHVLDLISPILDR